MRLLKLAPIFLILFFSGSFIKAQDSLPDSVVMQRIHIIQTMLDEGRKNANLWWYGWLVGYGTASAAQGVIFIYSDKLATKQDMALGAVTNLLGAGFQLITPMTPGFAASELEEIPEGTPEENLIKLYEAEKLLEKCAKREKDGRSWKIHVLNGAVNMGCGLVVWLGFKRSLLEGVINFGVNTAVCEIQIFTQPTRAIKDYNLYCSKYKSDQSLVYAEAKITWSFVAIPGGLGLKLRF
jgi:hypothetical protein